ncbi:hypothetical protein BJX76DRAFT_355588 [Aspergillus varians]
MPLVSAPRRLIHYLSKAGGESPRQGERTQQDTRSDRSNETSMSPGATKKQGSSMEDKNLVGNPKNDAYLHKVRTLEAQIQEMSAEHDQFSQETSATIQHLTKQLQMRDKSMENQDDRIRQQDAEIERLQRNIVEMPQRPPRQFQPVVVTKWHAPREDRIVRDDLSKLVDRVRTWARKYSVACYSDLDGVPTSDKDLAMGSLNGHCIYDNWDTTIEKLPIRRDKIPAILVQAILAKEVFERFFTDPFFAFMSIEGDQSVPRPEGMRILQHAMTEEAGEAEAHLWRSQTIRSLSNTETHAFLRARAEKSCSEFASGFLGSPVRVLLRPDAERDESNEKRFEDLQSLYKGAAQLALSLWGQRAFISCRGLQDLPRFTVANELMSAHRLHQIDEDDTSLDGSKVLLVVQPAILAFGSEDAEHYDQHKVWAPATVLLEAE